ncbi:hypothetical protein BU24DRAFT_411176 [Aaosphaeria arxii CBS 175.79]|uniref:Uncharacterized protein n=1 Tax=Aaosphaeria arxii CBS 175.79 TaxID=1450172 RepID=A0A6A5XL33_9PLEO|nr:uncharacterized protein BU24DRAFT_411176 [Aaosphaeria arxii CBS 175.79]KAF2013440.1 hypothetical protein BU24DRAFT_411176 [Aaosphaeria arxii CBS 175.79]
MTPTSRYPQQSIASTPPSNPPKTYQARRDKGRPYHADQIRPLHGEKPLEKPHAHLLAKDRIEMAIRGDQGCPCQSNLLKKDGISLPESIRGRWKMVTARSVAQCDANWLGDNDLALTAGCSVSLMLCCVSVTRLNGMMRSEQTSCSPSLNRATLETSNI